RSTIPLMPPMASDPVLRRAVAELTMAGRSCPEIASQLFLSRRTVTRIRSAAGIVSPLLPTRNEYRERLIVAMTLAGRTKRQIAAELGINPATVGRVRRLTNTPSPLGCKRNPEHVKAVTTMTLAGCSITKIAAELGLHHSTVGKIRQVAGVCGLSPHHPQRDPFLTSRVIAMSAERMPVWKMAVELGVTDRTVHRIRRAEGISKPAAPRYT